MSRDDDGAWFAPKMFGYGAGLPVTWQGWLVTLIYIGIVGGAAMTLEDRPLPLMSIVVTVTILFVVVAAKKTRGGWHWRWWGRRSD